MMLTEMKVHELLQEVASNSPAPGGGSVSALSGAFAASLVAMVARLTLKKKDLPEETREKMEYVLAKAEELKESLTKHVQTDTDIFKQVMEAYRLPKGSKEEQENRYQAVQTALKLAARHPLEVAEECLKVQTLVSEAVAHGNPSALSDVGVASLLAHAGLVGALYNVAINLDGIEDMDFGYYSALKSDLTMTDAVRLEADVRSQLNSKLNYKVYW
jgi:formiminotetrahydrofolate cyclodeaminase